jgi:hypothetical protein
MKYLFAGNSNLCCFKRAIGEDTKGKLMDKIRNIVMLSF